MPLWHFLDPRVEDLSLLFWLGGPQEEDLPLVSPPPLAAAPHPCVEVGVVLALVVAVRAPVVC